MSKRLHLQPKQQGFTLLELILVILLMGFMVAGVVMNIGQAGDEKELHQQARQLQARLNFAIEQSLLNGYDMGLVVERHYYQFVQMKDQSWQALEEGPLTKTELADPFFLELELGVEEFGFKLSFSNNSDQNLFERDFISDDSASITPQILILSSGDVSPFSLKFSHQESPIVWQLSSDEIGRLELENKTID